MPKFTWKDVDGRSTPPRAGADLVVYMDEVVIGYIWRVSWTLFPAHAWFIGAYDKVGGKWLVPCGSSGELVTREVALNQLVEHLTKHLSIAPAEILPPEEGK